MVILEKGAKIVLFEKHETKMRYLKLSRKLLMEGFWVQDVLDRSELIPYDTPSAWIFMKKVKDLLPVFF
jgi:hypothetical protein